MARTFLLRYPPPPATKSRTLLPRQRSAEVGGAEAGDSSSGKAMDAGVWGREPGMRPGKGRCALGRRGQSSAEMAGQQPEDDVGGWRAGRYKTWLVCPPCVLNSLLGPSPGGPQPWPETGCICSATRKDTGLRGLRTAWAPLPTHLKSLGQNVPPMAWGVRSEGQCAGAGSVRGRACGDGMRGAGGGAHGRGQVCAGTRVFGGVRGWGRGYAPAGTRMLGPGAATPESRKEDELKTELPEDPAALLLGILRRKQKHKVRKPSAPPRSPQPHFQ